MPDLGPYAVEVGLAYAGTLAAIAALVVLSIRRGRRVRAQLNDVEARQPRKAA